MNTNQIDQLKKLGTEWTKNEMCRIYFDNLPKWNGLNAKYYNSGNISSATFRGEEISNTTARGYEHKFDQCKLWFDLNTGEFGSRGFEKLPKSLAYITAAITAKIS